MQLTADAPLGCIGGAVVLSGPGGAGKRGASPVGLKSAHKRTRKEPLRSECASEEEYQQRYADWRDFRARQAVAVKRYAV